MGNGRFVFHRSTSKASYLVESLAYLHWSAKYHLLYYAKYKERDPDGLIPPTLIVHLSFLSTQEQALLVSVDSCGGRNDKCNWIFSHLTLF